VCNFLKFTTHERNMNAKLQFLFTQDLASWRFIQRNIVRIIEWSSFLDTTTHKDSIKI
jgi:hypothetical protein